MAQVLTVCRKPLRGIYIVMHRGVDQDAGPAPDSTRRVTVGGTQHQDGSGSVSASLGNAIQIGHCGAAANNTLLQHQPGS